MSLPRRRLGRRRVILVGAAALRGGALPVAGRRRQRIGVLAGCAAAPTAGAAAVQGKVVGDELVKIFLMDTAAAAPNATGGGGSLPARRRTGSNAVVERRGGVAQRRGAAGSRREQGRRRAAPAVGRMRRSGDPNVGQRSAQSLYRERVAKRPQIRLQKQPRMMGMIVVVVIIVDVGGGNSIAVVFDAILVTRSRKVGRHPHVRVGEGRRSA